MGAQQLFDHFYKKPFVVFFFSFLKSFGQFVILQEQEDACAAVINMPVWARKREDSSVEFHRHTEKKPQTRNTAMEAQPDSQLG